MPKRYSSAHKLEALRLLDLYDYKVSVVEQLTGISDTTLYRWRDEHFMKNPDLSGKKSFPIPDERIPETDPPPPPPDEPAAGVPGKTYPYPLEDDADADTHLGDFRRVREVLMKHAQQLAASLQPDDPDINRRSLALARILDRIHHLDNLLPDLIPERVVRHEFVYDGMVHNIEPWKRSEEYLLSQLEFIRERKAQEARKSAEQDSDSD